jgi:CheY-like chemotaxis protein
MSARTAASLVGIRVLAVEDQHDALDALILTLQHLGATVTGVTSAQSALELLQREPCDVLISDLMLPGIDGFELLARIRMHGRKPPAIAVTGYGGEVCRRALAHGFHSCMAKPIDPEALADVVLAVTGRRQVH